MNGTGRREAIEVTVVVPTFNERENIPLLIGRIESSLRELRWELIVVDDDSPDGTAEVVRRIAALDHRIRCIRRVNRRGLAGACLEGMLAAQAQIVVVMDADLQHDAALIPDLYAAIAYDYTDIAVASRFLSGHTATGLSGRRLMSSRFAIAACRKLLDIKITDPLSGFFAARRSVVDAAAPNLSVDGFKILLDLIATSGDNPRLIEFPCAFEARTYGLSKLDACVSFDFVALLLAKLWGGRLGARSIRTMSIRFLAVAAQMTTLWLLSMQGRLSFTAAELCALAAACTTAFCIQNALAFSDRRHRGWSALKGLATFFLVRATPCLISLLASSWLYDASGAWWAAGMAGALLGAAGGEFKLPRPRCGLEILGPSPL